MPLLNAGSTARPLRIEYAGAHYHVTSRGKERKAIFRDDTDGEKFLLTKQFKPFQLFNRCAQFKPNDPELGDQRSEVSRIQLKPIRCQIFV